MKLTTDKRIVQTGEHILRKGEVREIPTALGEQWLAAKLARVPTEAELTSAEKPTKPKS